VTVNIRLYPDEAAEVVDLAAQDGRTPANFVRHACRLGMAVARSELRAKEDARERFMGGHMGVSA